MVTSHSRELVPTALRSTSPASSGSMEGLPSVAPGPPEPEVMPEVTRTARRLVPPCRRHRPRDRRLSHRRDRDGKDL